MRTPCLATLLALVVLLAPAPARAGSVPPVSLSHALRAAGSWTFPAAWAGIWSTADTIQSCDGRSVMLAFTRLDTLCAGGAFGPDTTQNQCTGTFTDTDFDITCTGQETISPTCSSAFTEHLQGTRNGDAARVAYTVETTYTPALCAGYDDGCSVTRGTFTRVAVAPPDCTTTPVHMGSWGRLKLLYR